MQEGGDFKQIEQGFNESAKGPQTKRKIENIEEIKETEKTPLHRAYTIWALMKQPRFQNNSYLEVVKPAATFATVEDFWAVYSHFKRPSLMSFGTSLYLFGEGIKPMWEDEQCKDGGRWMIKFPKTHMNKYWEDVVLAMIGEQLGDEGQILGVQLAIRPNQDVLSVWVRNGADKEQVQKIKADLERTLMLDESTAAIVSLDYEVFAEMLQRRPAERPPREGPAGAQQNQNAFNRNIPKQNEGEEDKERLTNQKEQEFGGFERGQMTRGGGFTRGMGRGRGDYGGAHQKRGGAQSQW